MAILLKGLSGGHNANPWCLLSPQISLGCVWTHLLAMDQPYEPDTQIHFDLFRLCCWPLDLAAPN